jgi:restriction endonuclease Mrr
MKRKRTIEINFNFKLNINMNINNINIEETSDLKLQRKKQKIIQELNEITKEKSKMKAGTWLEEASKRVIEYLGGICTISKAHSIRPKRGKTFNIERDFKVIGDYGIDGIGEITFNNKKYKFILQCKNWSREISSSEISALEGVLNRFSRYIGLFITRNGANRRARNSAKESVHNIIIMNIEELFNLENILRETTIKTFIGLSEEIEEEYQGLTIDMKNNIIKAEKLSHGIKRTYAQFLRD